MQCADGEFNGNVEEELVESVTLTGAALVRYIYQAIKLKREGAGDHMSTLGNFTNCYVYFGSVNMPACKRAISLHTESHAPKFAAVVRKVVECHVLQEKCIVHCSRRTGYKALLSLLQEAGIANDFSVADLSLLADFNAKQNNRGQQYICMVADTDAGSESIEFKCVRHHILVDVPEKHQDYYQRCGRSVRTNSHAELGEAEREVRFKMLRATLPDFATVEVGAFALWALCGFWGGPKKVTYNSEPEPSSVEEGAQALAEAFESEGWGSLEDLRQNSRAANELVEEMDLEPKLIKRMLAALTAIRDSPADFYKALSLECDTIDERRLNELQREAARQAPAVAKVRYHAIDAGMY
mmetsp:Transcript_39287/g.126108  ORF Transcript_39287/g.126108 Transcript_39287/m.126108 type:complete len:354 (+) Transcript_39287:1320-2381(+)